MRNLRALVMIGISLVAGIAAMVLALRWLTDQTSVATTKVAVAAVDLEVGQAIGVQQLRLVDWPSGGVPGGAFQRIEDLDGRVVKLNVLRDEPILESKLAAKGTRGGLSAVIAEGKRAITVRVNDVVGVAGFALPGNYVDIIVNTQDESSSSDKTRTISKIVLEKILVLAIAQEAGRDDTKPKVVNAVTLEVTPMEAEKIDLARSVGTLSLVLRNQIDPDAAKTAGATKDTLLGKATPQPRPQPQATPQTVTVVRTVRVPARTTVAQVPPPPHCVESFVGKERSTECFRSGEVR